MKKNQIGTKEMFIIGGAILIILIAVLCFVLFRGDSSNGNNNENSTVENGDNNVVDNPKPNTNEGVIGDKEVAGLTFTKSALITSANGSTLTTLVTNTTSSDIEVRIFDIYVKDKDGNLLVTLQGYVGGVVPKGASREIESNVDMDLSNATDIEYKLIK